jgi:hypothetical protein
MSEPPRWTNDDDIREAIADAVATQRLEGIVVAQEEQDLLFEEAKRGLTHEEFIERVLAGGRARREQRR